MVSLNSWRSLEQTRVLGGINNLTLGYTSAQIDQLVALYNSQSTDPLGIDGTEWLYMSGALPGDTGQYDVGDSWIYGGKYYVKLGSGLEGAPVPESVSFFIFGLISAVCHICRRKTSKAILR